MNEKIEQYINKRRAEIEEQQKKERNEFLIEIGLYDVEYADSDEYSDEYPDTVRDPETGRKRFCKKIALEVTDEEYEELRTLTYQGTYRDYGTWTSGFLRNFAVILILVGIFTTITITAMTESILLFTIGILTTLTFGAILLGISEMIRLLNRMALQQQ